MKVAISLPDQLFLMAEQLAASLNKPRSQLYSDALAAYLREHGAHDITRRLNKVYSKQSSALDPALARAQYSILPDETW